MQEVRPAARGRAVWKRSCASCGETYTWPAWAALPLATTLATETVQAHLSVPVLWAVERRACHCGALLAGLIPAPIEG